MENIKILVVDDDRLVALGIKEKLENLGYKVVEIASTGEEAIQCSSRKKSRCYFNGYSA